jgi:hypothetical protein
MVICQIYRKITEKNNNKQIKITNKMTYDFSIGDILFVLLNIHFLFINKLG